MATFRYSTEVQEAIKPWEKKLGEDFWLPASILRERDRQIEDFVSNLSTRLGAIDSGTAVGAWTSYTPSDSAITLGNGTRTAAWMRLGRTIFFRYKFVLGTTSAVAAGAAVGLPVASVAVEQEVSALFHDTGTRAWPGVARIDATSTTAAFLAQTSGGDGSVTSLQPFTWTTGDFIVVSGTYEAAA